MPRYQTPTVEERLDALERDVTHIKQHLNISSGQVAPATEAEARAPEHTSQEEDTQYFLAFSSKTTFADSDAWIGKAGIALLILGATFLFKLAIDMGWVTPVVRVTIGALLGAGLIAGRYRLKPEQTLLRRLLPGGGIAIWYIALFAAVSMYHLIPAGIAWALLAGIALSSGIIARTDTNPTLTWVALLGALQGPLTLGVSTTHAALFLGYVNAVVAGALYLAYLHGWRQIAWGAFLAGSLTLGVAGGARAVIELGEGIQTLAFALPTLGSLAVLWVLMPKSREDEVKKAIAWMGVANFVMPAVLLPGITGLFVPEDYRFSTAFLAGAVFCAAAGLLLVRRWQATEKLGHHAKDLADAFALPVAAFCFLFILNQHEGARRYSEILWLALAMGFWGHKNQWRQLSNRGANLAMVMGIWVAQYLILAGFPAKPVLNISFLLLVQFIGVTALLAFQNREEVQRGILGIILYIALLALPYNQLGGITGGHAVTSVLWTCFGVALFFWGRNDRELLFPARVTFAAVLVKLFFVDLTELAMIWKTLAFMLVGGLFLGVSYLLARHARKQAEPAPET